MRERHADSEKEERRGTGTTLKRSRSLQIYKIEDDLDEQLRMRMPDMSYNGSISSPRSWSRNKKLAQNIAEFSCLRQAFLKIKIKNVLRYMEQTALDSTTTQQMKIETIKQTITVFKRENPDCCWQQEEKKEASLEEVGAYVQKASISSESVQLGNINNSLMSNLSRTNYSAGHTTIH